MSNIIDMRNCENLHTKTKYLYLVFVTLSIEVFVILIEGDHTVIAIECQIASMMKVSCDNTWLHLLPAQGWREEQTNGSETFDKLWGGWTKECFWWIVHFLTFSGEHPNLAARELLELRPGCWDPIKQYPWHAGGAWHAHAQAVTIWVLREKLHHFY